MIEVKNLTVSFGDKTIFEDISFSIKDREKLSILGPSGQGKSVLLRTILGLIKPNEGSIIIDNVDLNKAKPKELINLRRKIGVLFQGSALFDFMTVYENVKFPLLVNKNLTESLMKKKVQESLELVGLQDSIDKSVDELSGGMQKRVALARAIVSEPKYLFYDEPTSGLDPVRANDINDLIKTLNFKYDACSITVTHDMESISKVSEKVLFLFEGCIEFFDKIDNMSKNKKLNSFIHGQGKLL